MHFVLQTPSLQHLAGVKIVAQLWSQRDVFTQIAQTFTGLPINQLREDEQKWKEMKRNVESKVSALPLPETCESELLNFVKPIGIEILNWCCYYCDLDDDKLITSIAFHHQLRWTTRGTIDYKKTAELLLKDERVDVVRRYEVACYNCLEDEAGELLRRMDKERRWEYMISVINGGKRRHRKLIIFFICALSGRVDWFNSIYDRFPGESINKRLFKYTLQWCSRATCEYFYLKLNREEKYQVFEDCRKTISDCRDYPTCSLLYYLSLMNEEQQQRMFHRCIRDVLIFLLRWPTQSLFVEAAECGWRFLDQDDCAAVLKCIVDIINDGFEDYDYSQLFRECWGLIPAEYKQFYLNDYCALDGLFQTKKDEFIKLVFNEASLDQILELFCLGQYLGPSEVLMDGSIPDAALMECKETVALNSSKEPQDVEKRCKSDCVNRLIDLVMKRRLNFRRL